MRTDVLITYGMSMVYVGFYGSNANVENVPQVCVKWLNWWQGQLFWNLHEGIQQLA